MKKLITIAIAVAMAVTAVPAVSNADTVEDLQAQIADLLAQVNTLQAQLSEAEGTTSTSAPAACSGVSFTRNLSLDSEGDDVKCLQALLNQDENTILAQSGVGSPGNETSYFGNLTKAAVVEFQNVYSSEVLEPIGLNSGTGFVGTQTRAKLNTMLTAAEDEPAVPEDEDEDEDEDTEDVDDSITTPGAEGSITAKYATSPIAGEDVYANSTGDTIAGIEVKALNSDVVVKRVDIKFTSRPWLYVSKLSIADGTTIEKTMDVTSANTIETTVGSDYTVRVSGLNILVPQDTTKTLNVKIDAILPVGVPNATVNYQVIADAIRGTDGAGLTQEAPASLLDSRSFDIKTSDEAQLEVSESTDNPTVARNVKVSETATTEDVLLLEANIKSKYNSSVIREITATTTAPEDSVLKLYDGSTLLDSVTQTADEAAQSTNFSDFGVSIAKDATKTLTIKADIPKEKTGKSASAVLPADADIFAEDATAYTTIDVGGSDVEGSVANFYYKVPKLTLSSASLTPVDPGDSSNTQLADFKIKVDVAADGGDIYVADHASSGLSAITNVNGASATITDSSLDSNASEKTNAWLVTNGATRWFEISGRVENEVANAYYFRVLLDEFNWGTTEEGANENTQDYGLDLLRTPEALLEARN